MAVASSDLVHLTSQVMADAQARLRGLAMASTNLEFERAAELRDTIAEIRSKMKS